MTVVTIFVLCYLLYTEIVEFYLGVCLSENEEHAMYDPDLQSEGVDQGICTAIIVGGTISDKRFSTLQTINDIAVLLPIIVFFLLDQPHDCFTCLGKDPDHLYSSF